MNIFSATVTRSEYLTTQVLELDLLLNSEDIPTFTPGQFVQFEVAPKLFRAYSIVSRPSELPKLTFCIKLEEGPGSAFVKNLKIGDSVPLRGPLGTFIIKNTERDIVMFANGVGIAPFKCMIPELLEQNFSKRLTLVWGIREQSNSYYADFFQNIANRYNNFSFIPAFTRPTEQWSGQKGRVTDYVRTHHAEHVSALFYLCGSLEMVQEVRALLLENKVENSAIKLEIFT